jgi:hypothetical protein
MSTCPSLATAGCILLSAFSVVTNFLRTDAACSRGLSLLVVGLTIL